jgi:hypothetical protein
MRNAWMAYSGQRVRYSGQQFALYAKMFGLRIINDMAKVLGPYSFIEDTDKALAEGIFEVGQRCGICVAPGGTPEALKIGISRALQLGR